MELTDLERIALAGLLAREREILDRYVLPWRADRTTLVSAVEARLGLPPGAIGTTHALADDRVLRQEPADAETH